MEVFISGLPRSIEGNVTASKPQTLEEAVNIAQRLMDQIIKRDSVQETNDHKRKFEDKRNIIDNNNYPKYRNNNHSNNRNNDNYQNNYNNHNHNNDYHHQQNRRQEDFRTYTATKRNTGNHPLCERTVQWGANGSSETTTERYTENYNNVSQDIRGQLNAEAEAIQVILIGIDNDIYSTVDACPNACEMWIAIERLKQC
ncbi:hypothetical protein Tco_1220001 [Tanacetum coccineum]